MEVILLERVRNLGSLGQQVKVKAGYGRNYLVPFGKAVAATKANIEKFAARRAELEKKEAEVLAQAQQQAAQLQALPVVTITCKASEEGKLFGSIGVRELAAAITDAGIKIGKSAVRLPEGPIRSVGSFTVELQLHSDVIVELPITVTAG